MTVTSKQILEAAGLKSPKTLTRWAKAGVIPEPHIGTHPAGRGKIAYWPNWVLERSKRIAELVRQGNTPGAALSILEHERTMRLIEEAQNSPDLRSLLSKKKVKLPDGREASLESLLHAIIVKAAENIVSSEPLRSRLLAQMQNSGVAEQGLQLTSAGYNPVCLADGERIEVVPDFVVSHRLSEQQAAESAWVVIPMLPSLRKAFSALGLTSLKMPNVRPAPKVWARDADAVVEYSIFPGGALGFELIRETARTIGMAPEIEPEEESSEL
jgi:hypothetical protein